MSLFLPGRVVVFDYGEVISRTPQGAWDTLVAMTGVPADELLPVYQELRHDLDRGDLTVLEYWRAIAARTGRRWSLTDVHRFWAVDFTGWFEVDPEVLAIVEELHDAGTRLALLSNAGRDFGDPYRWSPMGSVFETVVVSAEEHVLKPDASVYRTTCERLGITAEQMVFVDNRAENAAGADAIGAVGHHFTSPAGLRAFLQDLAARNAEGAPA